MTRDDFAATMDDLMARRRRQSVAGPLVFISVLTLAMLGLIVAMAAADERDVPSSARREIAMRGESIEHVDGQVRADAGEDRIGQAAETPPDDSSKWHLTILTVGNCQACEKLKADLAGAAEFRDWVDPADHARSFMHLHALRYDGAIGRDWGRKLEKFLRRPVDSFPTIVVQPPVNGSFGKHTDVAFMQEGYGDAEKLTAAMAKAIGKYCQKLRDVRQVARADGHEQEGEQEAAGEEELGATPPPFLLAPQNPQATQGTWDPRTIIPPRVAATIEQIKAVCAGCDVEFLLSMISRQATIEEAIAAWQAVQVAKQAEDLKRQIEELRKLKDQATPAAGGFSWTTLTMAIIAAVTGTAGLGGVAGWGLTLYRRHRRASGKPTLLTDEQFAALVAALSKLQTPIVP